ncbi:MAG: hypothetical protein SPG48_05750 [Treponema sp.]|nr:hypothetical protein [Treponema sp.]
MIAGNSNFFAIFCRLFTMQRAGGKNVKTAGAVLEVYKNIQNSFFFFVTGRRHKKSGLRYGKS